MRNQTKNPKMHINVVLKLRVAGGCGNGFEYTSSGSGWIFDSCGGIGGSAFDVLARSGFCRLRCCGSLWLRWLGFGGTGGPPKFFETLRRRKLVVGVMLVVMLAMRETLSC